MKIKVMERILLTIYTLVIFMLSLGLLLISLQIIPWHVTSSLVSTINNGWSSNVISIIASLVLMLISIRILLIGFSSNKPSSSLLKATELGVIRVSIGTLDNLAQKVVRTFDDVKDVKSIILPDLNGIKVQLKITIMPDIKMPELTVNIQSKVKEYIEEISGISVMEVQVYIDNITTTTRNRVE